MNNIRVRFAPSPTGPLHIGGVRTALFNYLFAKKNNGSFILRIEDTDQSRYVKGAEEYIIESLKWCGIEIDEGVSAGGPYEPYRQSERKKIYKNYADRLVDIGAAYYAFDTQEELDEMRRLMENTKSDIQHYCHATRMQMKNSFSLSPHDVKILIESGQPYVIRFNIPENKEIAMQDIIRGEITVNSSTLDDKVLFKSDGLPTYHLANIVDDHLMEVSHVIRGEEWLPSLPLHWLIYESFGWKKPLFAHLPLILKPNGKGKLSKRDGDQMGFPVFPLEWTDPETGEKSIGYRESGYFNDAFINMLALLGWNPGTEQEIFTKDELINSFSIDKVGKSGSKFDPEKTKWFNQQYLKQKNNKELADIYLGILKIKGISPDNKQIEKIIGLIKERACFVSDFWDLSHYFFTAPIELNISSVKKAWKADTNDILKQIIEIIAGIKDFTSANTEKIIKNWIEVKEIGFGKVLNPLRIAVVGSSSGPHLFDIFEILGKAETIKRLQHAINSVQV